MSGESETAETLNQAGKLQLADNARLMADNARLLSTASESDRRARDLQARVEDARAKGKFPDMDQASDKPQEGEDVKISIDSPTNTSHNHYYPELHESPDPPLPASSQPKPASWISKAATYAAMAAGGVGLTLAVQDFLAQPPPPEEVQAIETVDLDTHREWAIAVE